MWPSWLMIPSAVRKTLLFQLSNYLFSQQRFYCILYESQCHSDILHRYPKKRKLSLSGCTVVMWKRRQFCRSTMTQASFLRPQHLMPQVTQWKMYLDWMESRWCMILWNLSWDTASILPRPTSGWTSFLGSSNGSSVIFGDAHIQDIIVYTICSFLIHNE